MNIHALAITDSSLKFFNNNHHCKMLRSVSITLDIKINLTPPTMSYYIKYRIYSTYENLKVLKIHTNKSTLPTWQKLSCSVSNGNHFSFNES